jgi:hypothetical protein
MEAEPTRAIKIFYCYARKDKVLRDELDKHLEVPRRLGQVTVWYDREIQPGTDWRSEIDRHLNTSDIILLLVSPNFMHSDYCYGVEMHRALERHRAGEARVIPIILRPVGWKETPIGNLQALPLNGKPITRWPDRDEALQDVVRGIGEVVRVLFAHRQMPFSVEQERASNTTQKTVGISCPSCGSMNELGAIFCKVCGAMLVEKIDKQSTRNIFSPSLAILVAVVIIIGMLIFFREAVVWGVVPGIIVALLILSMITVQRATGFELKVSVSAAWLAGQLLFVIYTVSQSQMLREAHFTMDYFPSFNLSNGIILIVSLALGFFLLRIREILISTKLTVTITCVLSATSSSALFSYFYIASTRDAVTFSALGIAFGISLYGMFFFRARF